MLIIIIFFKFQNYEQKFDVLLPIYIYSKLYTSIKEVLVQAIHSLEIFFNLYLFLETRNEKRYLLKLLS